MLAVRLQRTGRSGYANYRIVVQEAQRHPSSGRVVAFVGSYNPHTKDSKVQVETAQKYIDNGAQPTPRVVKLLTEAGVKMPKWVKATPEKVKTTRNAEKLRKNQPKEEVKESEVAEQPEKSAPVAEEVKEVETSEEE